MSIKYIQTDTAPQALGHYSQAVVNNGVIYVSGQLPINNDNPTKAIGDITEQTIQTLRNLEHILLAAGSDLNHVLKTTIFISDISLWAEANHAYATVFGQHKPARSAVPVNDLPKGYNIEIEAIAAIIKKV